MFGKKIEKIVFVSNKGAKDYKEEAFIIYSDGSYECVSREEGTQCIFKMLRSEGVTTLKELADMDKVSFMHKNNFNTYLDEGYLIKKESKKNKKEKKNSQIDIDNKQDNTTDIKNKKESKKDTNKIVEKKKKPKKEKKKRTKLQKIWLGIKIGIVAFATFVVGSGIKIANDLFGPSKTKYNDEKDKTTSDVGNGIGKNSKMVALLNNYNVVKSRRNFISKTWDYLKSYNGDFAKLHTEKGTGTRLAHTWDEVVVQQLAYNNYSKDKVAEIFGSYEFDANILYDAYLSSIKQETQAHIVQTKSFEKYKLINSQKGKDFYLKYESMIINFNIQENNDKKYEIAREFYKTLREDFNFNKMDKDEIDSYKISITPIVNAMNKMCKNLEDDFVLSEDELDYFNDRMFNKLVLKKLNKYEKTVFTYGTATSAVGEDEVVSFEQYEDTAMEEIEKLDIYDVKKAERNISNHKDYQKRINWNYDASKSVESDRESSKVDSDSISNKKEKKNKVVKNVIDSEIERDSKEEENDEAISNDENPDTTDNNYDEPESDVDDNETENDNSEDVNSDEEENTDENEIGNDENSSTDDNIIEDENSNDYTTDDSITNITTDPTGAVDPSEPLPDPNAINTTVATSSAVSVASEYTKEEYAEMLVNDMAENPENYQDTEISYVYTK